MGCKVGELDLGLFKCVKVLKARVLMFGLG